MAIIVVGKYIKNNILKIKIKQLSYLKAVASKLKIDQLIKITTRDGSISKILAALPR